MIYDDWGDVCYYTFRGVVQTIACRPLVRLIVSFWLTHCYEYTCIGHLELTVVIQQYFELKGIWLELRKY